MTIEPFPVPLKMLSRRDNLIKLIVRGASILLALCFVPGLGPPFPAAPATAVRISPPMLYIHCLRDDGKIAFVVRWDYHFAYSSKNVSGFQIYRRIEGEDYSLVAAVNRSEAKANLTAVQEFVNRYVYSFKDDGVQLGKAYSYKVVAFDPAGNEGFNEVSIQTDPAAEPVAGPANVLVVINRSSRESVEIGEYYQKRRGVPKQNLLYLSYQGNSTILSMENFERKIKLPLRAYLASEGLKEKILYIVMTYGLPYKVSVRGGKSVDSVDTYLTDLFDEYRNDPQLDVGPAGGRYRNPYFLAASHFSRANGNRGYLVTRLDGPLANPSDPHYNRRTEHRDDRLQYLKNMIDYAIWAEQKPKGLAGKGYFDRRFKSPWASALAKGDLYISGAYDCCASAGFKSFLDTNPQLFGASPTDSGGDNSLFCDNALWYAGWYSHFYKDVFGWVTGAVGFHIESWTAQDIRAEATSRGRSGWVWVPGMIRAGITATMGPVHEPGLGGVPQIDWFFRYFVHGFSFAEAAYMANYSSGGQMVMIGDPLYKPFRDSSLDRTPPTVTITSPRGGETIRGTKILIEGTVDDLGISMLDNFHPVREGRFSFTQTIGSSGKDRARIPVVVCATDTSGNAGSAAVTVTWANAPPRLQPIAPTEISEGKTLTFTLKASDPDADRLSYYFARDSARPRGASLSRRAGRFKWKPTFEQNGTYDFGFRVTDDFASDVKRATITVRQAGSHPPKFASPPKKIVRKTGQAVYFVLKAEDLDGDALTFSAATPLPEGARLRSSPDHAVFLWRPTPEQVGAYKIAFTVSDGKGGKDAATVELQITPAAPRPGV